MKKTKLDIKKAIKEIHNSILNEKDLKKASRPDKEDELSKELDKTGVVDEPNQGSSIEDIQQNLQDAHKQAQGLGDPKLAQQIANTLTYLMRSHVLNKEISESNIREDISKKKIQDLLSWVKLGKDYEFVPEGIKVKDELTADDIVNHLSSEGIKSEGPGGGKIKAISQGGHWIIPLTHYGGMIEVDINEIKRLQELAGIKNNNTIKENNNTQPIYTFQFYVNPYSNMSQAEYHDMLCRILLENDGEAFKTSLSQTDDIEIYKKTMQERVGINRMQELAGIKSLNEGFSTNEGEKFKEIFQILGEVTGTEYDDFDEFIGDNPGASEVLITWIEENFEYELSEYFTENDYSKDHVEKLGLYSIAEKMQEVDDESDKDNNTNDNL